jgi:glutamate formiminotransferase
MPASVLAVPNWSITLSSDQRASAWQSLSRLGLTVHFLDSDIDHARTVTAFSGDWDPVIAGVQLLANAWLPIIDLRHHSGVHPRIGALDVCPFVPIGILPAALIPLVSAYSVEFSESTGIPVDLYEWSAKATLPELRSAAELGHHRWGRTVMGVRPFLIALNLNFPTLNFKLAKSVATQIRSRRNAGALEWMGVRVLTFQLENMGCTQLSFNITRPDLVHPDDVVKNTLAMFPERMVWSPELIGVIRDFDLPFATELTRVGNAIRDEQVVRTK